jgi:AmmeMemoRadiSam system protein A
MRTDDDRGPVLLGLARQAISAALGVSPQGGVPATTVEGSWLAQPGASFVTLLQAADLRGCIGTLEPHRTLAEDVRSNAVAAALHDPRFPPLALGELARTTIEVSLLGPAESLTVASEGELAAVLRPGVDGLILALGYRRATFLPQVWTQLPDPGDFIRHLQHKAGLPSGRWPPGLAAWRYEVEKWSESAERPMPQRGMA